MSLAEISSTPSTVTNPLRDGNRGARVPKPCNLVIFGITGDLAARKLVPALYNLYLRDLLPAGFAIVGAGRQEMTDDEVKAALRTACDKFSRTKPSDETWAHFADLISYAGGDFAGEGIYGQIAQKLEQTSGEHGSGKSALYYLSVPPSVFPAVVEGLGKAGLAYDEDIDADPFRRVIIEKPFGHDLATAERLNGIVHGAFEERQVFRIDHYLGKETVQNILVFRFANGIFEPVWNRNFVDHVQITVAESIGVDGRGKFYEEAGALRDIVQNHMLQVLSFVAMEPASSFDPEAVRSERSKLLRSVRTLTPSDVVRGQFKAGYSDGIKVPGYRQEDGVDPHSEVETYVAARFSIENWRWSGTPFYLRTGKRLPKRVSEVAIQFKGVPHLPFSYAAAEQLEPNELVLRIQPDEGISLRFGAKVPAPRIQLRTVNMDFDYDTAFAAAPAEAYETLLLDAMRGDSTNFPRQDAVEDSWRIVEPVLDSWANEGGSVHSYEAGTWGPEAADTLLARDGRRWRRP